MNKRILHLLNQAGFHQPEMERLGIEHKFEKFAELIVRECASVCESATQEGQPLHLVSIGYADRIKHHFGVKE